MLSVAGALRAQQTAPLTTVTLPQAVENSLKNYPSIRVSQEQINAAAAAIQLARTAYLPRADFLAQVNRATHNNVFGLLLPQSIIPTISGPVLGTNSLNNVWGSAAGTLVSWEPIDFGLRRANVGAAIAARDRTTAEVNVTKLQVATAAADAFLTIVAAQQTVIAARAGVNRASTFNVVIQTLVKNELRPGADASRTRAELALAQTQLIQAEQAVDVSRAALAQFLGIEPSNISPDPGPLLQPPSSEEPPATARTEHPLVNVQSAAVNEVKARERVLDRTYFPKFNLQGAAYARGTGVQADGSTGGAGSGLGPNIQNWAVGLSVSFPALDFFSIRARKSIEAANERAQSARYDQIVQDLNSDVAKARAVLNGSRRVAQNTPIQLEAARATERQATARYKAGLGNITEVAEAQRLLTQAEIDDSLARLGVWRALLGVAAAQGDISEFLQKASR
ncbi:MAG: TolC family protein [Acidobacteriota bacterium]|nr:TolC family protein [Acidobacteriota bacterium]